MQVACKFPIARSQPIAYQFLITDDHQADLAVHRQRTAFNLVATGAQQRDRPAALAHTPSTGAAPTASTPALAPGIASSPAERARGSQAHKIPPSSTDNDPSSNDDDTPLEETGAVVDGYGVDKNMRSGSTIALSTAAAAPLAAAGSEPATAVSRRAFPGLEPRPKRVKAPDAVVRDFATEGARVSVEGEPRESQPARSNTSTDVARQYSTLGSLATFYRLYGQGERKSIQRQLLVVVGELEALQFTDSDRAFSLWRELRNHLGMTEEELAQGISKLRRQKEKPTGSAARLDSSPDSDSSCSTDLDSSSSPHSNSSSSSDFDYSSFSSDGDTSSNGDTSSDGDALSDNDDDSDDASSDGASDGDSSSEFSSADEEERDDLDAARNWPPYEIDADDTEARITKTGYEVTFLLTDDDATLADLDKEEQIDELASLLRQNRSFGNFQYLLPPPDKADQLLPLTSCIPTNVVAVPDDGLFAIQPLPSSLNRDIGLGLFSNLTYYCYAIEAYAETEQEAEAFVAFMKSPAMRQRARELGQLRTLEIWYEGIATFRELGGWAGELARLFAYVGESDGWDRLDKNGNAPIRPLHHLSYLKYRLGHPTARVQLFMTFVSTAEHLPDNLPLYQVKLVEALLSLFRLSSVTLGGANVAPCGRTNRYNDILSALLPLPLLVPISIIWSQQLVPSSIACMLKRKFNEDNVTSSQIKAQIVVEQLERRQKGRKNSRQSRQKQCGPRRAKFRRGLSGPANFERPSERTLKSLRVRYTPSLPGISIPESIQSIVAPFFGKPYFRRVVEVTTVARADRDAIMTPDNCMQGVVANLAGGSTRVPRARRLRLTTVAGDKAERIFFQVRSEEEKGPVVVSIGDGRLRVRRSGYPLPIRVKGKKGMEAGWSWNRAETKSKWLSRAKAKDEKNTPLGQRRQTDVEEILDALFDAQ